jgi:anti-sigma regulatory factor (Ser/Thr protein kinase)
VVDGAVGGDGGSRTGAEGGPHRGAFTGDARTATVAEARQWARAVLTAWDADELEWELSQLLTEVVTNAVLHAGTPLRVVLEQDVESGRLRCEVSDGSPVQPRLRHHSAEATTGRGLRLLENVAASWGVQRTSGGKTVWFELDGESGGRGQRARGDDFAALLGELASDEGTVKGGGKGAVARGFTTPSLGLVRCAPPPAWAAAAALRPVSQRLVSLRPPVTRPASTRVLPCSQPHPRATAA